MIYFRLIPRDSAEFFPAQYRGIPWCTAEFCIDLYTEFRIGETSLSSIWMDNRLVSRIRCLVHGVSSTWTVNRLVSRIRCLVHGHAVYERRVCHLHGQSTDSSLVYTVLYTACCEDFQLLFFSSRLLVIPNKRQYGICRQPPVKGDPCQS